MEQSGIIGILSINPNRRECIMVAIPAERENNHVDIADSILAQQALAGDERGFEQLVYRYHKLLFSYVYRFLGDRDQAYDVLQKVFLKLYLSLPELKLNQPLKPWLFRVAYHYCIDEFRSRYRKPAISFSELPSLSGENGLSLLETILDTNPLPETLAEDHDLQRRFMQALLLLPAKYRSIVLLRYVGQLSFPEIGQMLDIPATTAKTSFHRAKPFLRKALADFLW